ncbi:hypothetical protein ACFFRR_010821 [Megaselia abdita]
MFENHFQFISKFQLKMRSLVILSIFLFGAALADVIPAPLPEEFLRKMSNIQPRVIGGSDAAVKQFPYQVGISTKIDGKFYWCGGSVISESWVLTAAHCVIGEVESLLLIFGATDRQNPYEVGQARQNISNFDNGQVIIHPLYNPSKITNDVALVRLAQKLEFSDYIQPVKLPSNKVYNTFANSPAVISGWGKIADNGTVVQYLQYGYVTILDLNSCMSSYNPGAVTQGNICLDNKKSGVSSCNGDSGGPCVSTITGELIGITSFGSSKGCEVLPSAYSRVTHFRDWIKYHTGI